MSRVRRAGSEEVAAVLSVLDGAALATDHDAVAAATEAGEVFVATPDRERAGAGPVVGALVRDGEAIRAVAVRPGRRGQGIGRALVRAAAADRDRLVATCDAGVAPFYRALGFELSRVEPTAGTERVRGIRRSGG